MTLLVCGSRGWTDEVAIRHYLSNSGADLVIHGNARGVDRLADAIAKSLGIKTRAFSAEWGKYGSAAGPIRNRRMLEQGHPSRVVAFWDGKSRGTLHMIRIARKAGVRVDMFAPELTVEEKEACR